MPLSCSSHAAPVGSRRIGQAPGYQEQRFLNDQLAVLRAQGRAAGRDAEFAELARRRGFQYNGMILHEYCFSNLRASSDQRPPAGSPIARALSEAFGSVERWQTDFRAIGGLRGVGWVLLCQDPSTGRLSNHWVTLHLNGVPAGFKPLLVMDVWEHAFMRDYAATELGRYIDAFFRNVAWPAIERRLREPGAVRPAAVA
jgi:Fe-Mn family superoxide dismutase